MPSFYKKHSLRSISIIVLVALLCNAVVFNVLMKPKIAKALGEEWATIGHFILAIGQKIWEGAKWVAQKAWDSITWTWTKLNESKKWYWEITRSVLQTAARTLQRKLLTSITNTAVDVIEGRTSISDAISGKKGYVTDYVKNLFYDSLAAGANQFSQQLAGIDLCSPLGFETKAEAKIALNPPLSSKLADTMACTRQQMGQNLKNFYESFEGGWGSWLNVTQPNQNFAGSYLLALDAKLNITGQEQEAGKVKVTAAGGWNGVEQCDEWFDPIGKATFVVNADGSVTSKNSDIDMLKYFANNLILDPNQFTPATDVQTDCQQLFPDDVANCSVLKDYLVDCGLTPFGTGDENSIKQNIGQAQTCIDQCNGASSNCLSLPGCKGINPTCVLDKMELTCTKKSTKTPGQLVGQTFNKAVNWQSDWLLSSTEVGDAISVIADAAVNKVIGAGIESLGSWAKKTTAKAATYVSTIFGSDTDTIEQRQRDCKTRSSSIDRAACQKCAYVDPKRPEFKTCFDYEKAQLLSGAQLASNLGDSQFSANMGQVSILQQVIELKEQISRDLQKMGGGTYYANARNTLKSMQYLAKCRWQTCASHDIRQFMIQYCISSSDPIYNYDNLAVRCTQGHGSGQGTGVLNFGIPPTNCTDSFPRVGEMAFYCSAEEEKACGIELGTTIENTCDDWCRNEDGERDDDCYRFCTENRDITANRSDVGGDENLITRNQSGAHQFDTPDRGDDQSFSLCLNLAKKKALGQFNDTIDNVQGINSGAAYQANSLVEPFTKPDWLSINVNSQSSTCLANTAWLTNSISRAEFYQKTPRYVDNLLIPGWWDFNAQITIDDKIKSLETEIGQDSGYRQLHPEITDKTSIGVIDMTNEYGEKCAAKCTVDNVQNTSCFSDCVNVDTFNELSPMDIEAIFTSPNGKGLTKEREDKIGELRIQQWDVLNLQSQADAEKTIRKFVSDTIEVCSSIPQITTEATAENTAQLVAYENNIVQKIIAEQELYKNDPQLKIRAVDLANRIGGSIGGKTYTYDTCNIDGLGLYAENKDQLTTAGITSCPLTQLWLNYSYNSTKTGVHIAYSNCDNYNSNTPAITSACPLGCKINYNIGASTLLVQIENSIKSVQKDLEAKLSTITSDGISGTRVDSDLINTLNQQLADINAMMDPRNLRQKNQDIIQSLNEENCAHYVVCDKVDTKDQKGKECVWPGSDYAGKD